MKFEWSILWKPATWLRAIWTAANVFGCTCRYPIRYCTVRCAVCCTACLISWWSLIKWSGFLHNAFLSLSTHVEHLITKNISCSCLPLPALTQLSLLRRRVPKDVKYHLELRRAVSHSVTTAGYPYATNNSEYVGFRMVFFFFFLVLSNWRTHFARRFFPASQHSVALCSSEFLSAAHGNTESNCQHICLGKLKMCLLIKSVGSKVLHQGVEAVLIRFNTHFEHRTAVGTSRLSNAKLPCWERCRLSALDLLSLCTVVTLAQEFYLFNLMCYMLYLFVMKNCDIVIAKLFEVAKLRISQEATVSMLHGSRRSLWFTLSIALQFGRRV